MAQTTICSGLGGLDLNAVDTIQSKVTVNVARNKENDLHSGFSPTYDCDNVR